MHVIMAVVTLAAMIGTLADIITRDDAQVKHLPKLVWILIVILLPLIGIILWFAVGREYNGRAIDLGGFGDPRRSDNIVLPPVRQLTTEEELAAIDREIEFHEKQARLRRLEAERNQRHDN